jgi:pimeloyl-ACP methyl ester carboxylesterase
MVESQSIFFKNTTISYTDSGKGVAVVLLHGYLENKNMWNEIAAALSIKNRIITIDLLGHGATACMGYIHTMEDQAAIVWAVLQQLKIRKHFIVGHSMGGYVALAFAELYPEKIKGLVLINSTTRADSDERKANRDRAIKAVKKDYVTAVRLSIANLFSAANREKLTAEIEQIKKEALQTPLQGIIASLEGMKIRIDREVLLHFGPYPKMLVLGKNDPVLNFNETVDQIENTATELVVFEDGHMSHIENKLELILVLKRFFKEN